MRILLVALGGHDVACSRVRVHQYLPSLQARGVHARVLTFWPRADTRPPPTLGPLRRAAARLRVLERVARVSALAPRYDAVVVQRVLLPPRLQRLVARRARRLGFDFDDAIWSVHAGMTDARTSARRASARFASTLASSHAAFAATPVLADTARRHTTRVFELPSPVDCERYRPTHRPAGAGLVIGWIGSPSTSMYLRALLPVCRRLAQRHPSVRFEAVGADPEADLEPFRVRPWSLESERAHLEAFDVGLMPLDDDEWSRGKAGYKLLQYMACGIPSVASPVGLNVDLLRDTERGLLAGEPAAWERALTTLIAEPALRRRLGDAGPAFVRREYSLATWAPRYHAALDALAFGA